MSCDNLRRHIRGGHRHTGTTRINFPNEMGGNSTIDFIKNFLAALLDERNLSNTIRSSNDAYALHLTWEIQVAIEKDFTTKIDQVEAGTFIEAVDIGGITKHFLNMYVKTAF
jgi:hypothetical protein